MYLVVHTLYCSWVFYTLYCSWVYLYVHCALVWCKALSTNVFCLFTEYESTASNTVHCLLCYTLYWNVHTEICSRWVNCLPSMGGGGLSKFLKVNGKRTSTAYSFFLGGLSKFLKVNGKKTSIAYSYFLGGLSKFLKVNGKRTSIACSYLLYFGRCGVMGPQACVTVPVLHLSKHMKQVSSDPKMAPALLQLCT